MTRAFIDPQSAALSLLNARVPLRRNEGQFLGGVVACDDPLTDKQRRWLDILLDRYQLPPLLDDFGVAGHA